MGVLVHCLKGLGLVETNCYVIGDEQTGDALVIDPADDAPAILDAVQKAGWTVRQILATHAHFDHVLAAGDVKKATGAPFCLHRDDLPLLRAMPQTTFLIIGEQVPPAPEPDCFVEAGQVIEVGAIRLEVLFTPGHTPGHVSYVLREHRIVFSGDCLFAGSIGRTDLPGADQSTLMRSICQKLVPLGDDYTVAAGHMELTTIGRERTSNPFILQWSEEKQC